MTRRPHRFNTACVDDGDGLPNSCGGTSYGNWTPAEKRRIIAAHVYNDTQRYNSTMAAWDVANEAICDCQPMNYETCEDYMEGSSTAHDKCGWSDRYRTEIVCACVRVCDMACRPCGTGNGDCT